MSTKSLHVTTTDSEALGALLRTQLRARGHRQPRRTTTLSARVSLASRDAVRSVARRMRISTSALLGLLVDEIASPGGAAAKVLEEIAKMLALPPGANVDDILVAIGALGDELDGDGAPADGAPAAAEPLPAQLSRTVTPPTAKPDAPNPAVAFPTTPEQQKKWLDDRAAQRTKRAARSASTPQARGYDRAVKAQQATRAEHARRR